jgi:uncharacterized membrane protein YadS
VTTLAVLAGLVPVTALVLALLRAGRLEERHALAWLGAAAAVCGVAAVPAIRDRLGDLLAGDAAVAVLALASVALAALTLIAFAALTRVTRQARILAQRLALLEERVAAGAPGALAPPEEVDGPADRRAAGDLAPR